MADYERITLLGSILDNRSGTIGAGTDYTELRIIRGIVTAESGENTAPDTGENALIAALDDWIAAVSAAAPATDDYPEVERLRVLADHYSATDAGGTDYETIRLLRAISVATTP